MKTFKRLISMVVTVAMVFSLVLPNVSAALPSGGQTATVTIFHTNDMHGAIGSDGKSSVGMDMIAGIKANTPNSLLVDAGDFSQGNFDVSHDNGATAVKMMKLAGYDAAAMGNHEFDYALQDLYNNIALAADTSNGQHGFPVLAANVKGLGTTLQPYFTKELDNGVKVGVFGILTPSTAVTANPAKLSGITFEDVGDVANEMAKTLRTEQGCDVVICLSHCGYDEAAGDSSYDIANAATDETEKIDVIIDGHAHQVMLGDSSKKVGTYQTLIASTGTKLAYLGKVELTIDSTGVTSAVSTGLDYAAMNTYSDAAVKAAIDALDAEMDPILNKVVGKSKSNLWGGNVGMPNKVSIARRGETNMGSLVADARRWQAMQNMPTETSAGTPFVVLQGGGGIRDSIPAGDITQRQILTVLPFGGSDVCVEVTPKLFYEVIEAGLSAMTGQDTTTGALSADGNVHGRFPQASGFRYTYNVNGTASDVNNKIMGNRLKEIYLVNDDGTEVLLDRNDTTTKMILVCSEYEIGGGDGYYMLGNTNKVAELNSSDVALVDYIKYLMSLPGNEDGITVPVDSGRIKLVDSLYTADSFEATIIVKENDAVVADREFEVYSDGEYVGNAKTNAAGELHINLKNGPQEVTIRSIDTRITSEVAYIDNIAGLLINTTSGEFSTPLPQAVTDVENAITALPDEIKSDSDVEKVIDILLAIGKLSDEDFDRVSSDALLKLDGAIAKVANYNHTADNVTVSGDNLPWYVKVTVAPRDGGEDSVAGLLKGIPEGKTLADIYEIKLFDMLSDQEFQPEGPVNVTIVSKGVQDALKGIQVAHLKADGSVELLDAAVEGDAVSITTSSFSVFGIVGEKVESGKNDKPDNKNDSANTGDDFTMATVVTFTALAGVAFVALRKKKEN